MTHQSLGNVIAPFVAMRPPNLPGSRPPHLGPHFESLGGIGVSAKTSVLEFFGMSLPEEGVVFSDHCLGLYSRQSLSDPFVPSSRMKKVFSFVGNSSVAHTPQSVRKLGVMGVIGGHSRQEDVAKKVFSSGEKNEIFLRVVTSNTSRKGVVLFVIDSDTFLARKGVSVVDDGSIPFGIFAVIEHKSIYVKRLKS